MSSLLWTAMTTTSGMGMCGVGTTGVGGRIGCTVVHIINQHPSVLLLPLGALLWLAYKIINPDLLPGLPSTLTLLLPGFKQSHPFAATLSPISYIRARWALRSYAKSIGYKNGAELVKQLREDEEFDWSSGEKPAKGVLLRGWDRAMIWDDDCIDMVVLESWRTLSDPLSDDALKSTSQRGKADVMEQIAQHRIDCNNGQATPDSSLLDFWDSVDQRPPRGCGAVGLDWYREKGLVSGEEYNKRVHCDIDESFSNFSSWKASNQTSVSATVEELEEEAAILARGKDMFYRYGPPILVGLMHVGLAGGFASPRITDVLKATGYLMTSKQGASKNRENPKNRLCESVDLGEAILEEKPEQTRESTLPSQSSSERTFRRLLETMSFVLDIMEQDHSLTPPSMSANQSMAAKDGKELLQQGGSGWLSCCRVRFIHSNVRKRLSPLGSLEKSYPASSGVAINQEDLLATLTSFSIAPLCTLQRMGICPSDQERKDYIALWRHIGFYMGIEPHLLQRIFRDVSSAERFFCCVASHHFLAVTKFKYADQPPSISTYFGRDLDEVKRFDFNQGPALPLLYSVARRPPGNMNFSTLCNLSRFLLGDALANAVSLPAMTRRQYIGIRIRLFILAYPPLFARYYPRKQFGIDLLDNCRGLLRRVIIWSMKGEIVSFESDRDEKEKVKIELGVQEGKRLQRQYFHLMYELLAVSTLTGLFISAGLWWVARSIVGVFASLGCKHCTI